ncbi:hypothetical protein AKJ47_00445 [candidate division MSBL1 archaeon SCGC-AAA261G05]|uniref:Haloacid dehalogenase n=2 Tax=candidate division MSBL1 TaxID=215777 RepID=A0A133V1E0_9EURY|nr:hypothetical protein AKJ42_01190 [candidate division MSBL1 archaeon SCGC-AAA261C02]KXB04152.1 hypothetical protein AKJ47_00445 [candidate division MSBL1 archaeon SCGC-AAA261G05]
MPQEPVKRIREYLDSQEKVRERILDVSHRAIRNSSRAMAAIHRGEGASDILKNVKEDIESLTKILGSEPQFSDYGALLAAHREYAEAIITRTLMNGEKLPELEDLGVLKKAYLQALAESVGELRRHVLDLLREDELDEATNIYEKMEETFDILIEFDYPDSILPGFRHRKDVARRTIEKTRGDITNAVRQQKLEESLERVERKLGD